MLASSAHDAIDRQIVLPNYTQDSNFHNDWIDLYVYDGSILLTAVTNFHLNFHMVYLHVCIAIAVYIVFTTGNKATA